MDSSMTSQKMAKIQDELIKKAQGGDKEAFDALTQNYLPLIYGICLRYLNSAEDAEDATQESFVKIWKNLWKVDLSRSFKVWAAEIAKNTCLDLIKRRRTVPMSAFENDEGENLLADSLESTVESPEHSAERSLLRRLLAVATARLSPAYQKVLSLYYQQGLNFREIAEMLDEPLHTIKSRHRRAIMNLRLILAKTQE